MIQFYVLYQKKKSSEVSILNAYNKDENTPFYNVLFSNLYLQLKFLSADFHACNDVYSQEFLLKVIFGQKKFSLLC